MVGQHHQLNGYEFEQTLGDSDREAWHAAVHGVSNSWMRLSNEITTTNCELGVQILMDSQKIHAFIHTMFPVCPFENKMGLHKTKLRISKLNQTLLPSVVEVSNAVVFPCFEEELLNKYLVKADTTQIRNSLGRACSLTCFSNEFSHHYI